LPQAFFFAHFLGAFATEEDLRLCRRPSSLLSSWERSQLKKTCGFAAGLLLCSLWCWHAFSTPRN
jgi:hypothetical protein